MENNIGKIILKIILGLFLFGLIIFGIVYSVCGLMYWALGNNETLSLAFGWFLYFLGFFVIKLALKFDYKKTFIAYLLFTIICIGVLFSLCGGEIFKEIFFISKF